MKNQTTLAEKTRHFLIRLGIHKSVILITIIAILVSRVVSELAFLIYNIQPGAIGWALSITIPSILTPIFSYGNLKLIYELEELRQQIQAMANTDELTGVSNRRFFLELAERELARANRSRQPLSLILLDLDNFKRINDTFSHLCGDYVLQRVSQCCQAGLRRSDVFARYGGEEFILLLPDSPAEQALECAERFRQIVAGCEIVYAGTPIPTTASFGVTTWQGEDQDLGMLLRSADQALYQAKDAGKNTVCFYSPVQKATFRMENQSPRDITQ